jgi:hypothetical protein
LDSGYEVRSQMLYPAELRARDNHSTAKYFGRGVRRIYVPSGFARDTPPFALYIRRDAAVAFLRDRTVVRVRGEYFLRPIAGCSVARVAALSVGIVVIAMSHLILALREFRFSWECCVARVCETQPREHASTLAPSVISLRI